MWAMMPILRMAMSLGLDTGLLQKKWNLDFFK
jgi:hypothetical protein